MHLCNSRDRFTLRRAHDVPPVQAVLSWLRTRNEEKRWLAVVDNADDLSWVSSVVPK
jgi:hypothetical protein